MKGFAKFVKIVVTRLVVITEFENKPVIKFTE